MSSRSDRPDANGPLNVEFPVVPLLLPGEAPQDAGTRESSSPSPDGSAALDAVAPDAWTIERRARRMPTPLPRQVLRPTRSLRVARAASVPPPPGHGQALDLIDRSRPSTPSPDLESELTERLALGDFTGALSVAELLLGRDPDNVDIQACAAAAREHLEQLYSSRLGLLSRVPTVSVRDNDIRWLGLDHRAGFLLSRVDGIVTLEEILDVCGMPRLEALKTLVELCDADAIRFDG